MNSAATPKRTHPTALIADDEPLLREVMTRLLAQAWPELEIVALARNGREAVDAFEMQRPDICFLDVHMPGLSGIEAAQLIGRRAHLVFVTAFDQYAVAAFAQGVLDYLVKPVAPARLAETVARLQERLNAVAPALNTEALLQQLALQLNALRPPGSRALARLDQENHAQAQAQKQAQKQAPLRWLRASVGNTVRLIAVDDIDYLRSDTKYTRVAWRGEANQRGEALVRMPLKELLAQLDASQFAQVHRSVVVNLRAISHINRSDNETADVHLKGRKEVLPVSRSYLHLFRQM